MFPIGLKLKTSFYWSWSYIKTLNIEIKDQVLLGLCFTRLEEKVTLNNQGGQVSCIRHGCTLGVSPLYV